jgi:hypothetical protein
MELLWYSQIVHLAIRAEAWLELPQKIWMKSVGFLSYTDINKLYQVSKSFGEIANLSGGTILYLDGAGDLQDPEKLNALLNSTRLIKEIKI